MQIRNKLNLTVAALAVVLTGLLSGSAQAAGSATFSMTPAGGTYNNGSTITVSLYENSAAEPVNAVEADLAYDAAKLQVVSISVAGGAFSICPVTPSGSGGSVKIGCATTTPVSGNQYIGSVSFRALTGSGNTVVSYAASSRIMSSNSHTDVWDHAAPAATYTLATPATPPTGGTTPGTSPTTPSTSGGTTSTNTTATTPAPEAAEVTTTVLGVEKSSDDKDLKVPAVAAVAISNDDNTPWTGILLALLGVAILVAAIFEGATRTTKGQDLTATTKKKLGTGVAALNVSKSPSITEKVTKK